MWLARFGREKRNLRQNNPTGNTPLGMPGAKADANSGDDRRENWKPFLLVIARSDRDEAIHALVRIDGLLRGACHRARIRATRWLAMTARE
jgi:hypothetical protein